MLHPSQLSDIKSQVLAEINKKLKKWDDQLHGILLAFLNVGIENKCRGRIMDDYPWVHMNVRYTAIYVQPTIGDLLCKDTSR